MNRVLFYSEKFNFFLKNNMWEDSKIIEHFDIEVQKILPVLKYSFKANPALVTNYKTYKNIKIDRIINIDQPLQVQTLNKENLMFPGVIFSCFE